MACCEGFAAFSGPLVPIVRLITQVSVGMLAFVNAFDPKLNNVTGKPMSLWIQHLSLLLLCAANAIPVLACQQESFQRFPQTLDEAIDPEAGIKYRTATDRLRIQGQRFQDRKNQAINLAHTESRTGGAENLPEAKTRRPIPARQVSSNRSAVNGSVRISRGSKTEFEFGTVMMFPASDGRRAIESSVYKPPRRTVATNLNQSIELAQSSPLENTADDSAIVTSVIGPQQLLFNVPREFEIILTNTSPEPATNIIVQLKAPAGITISRLDRSAWLDETNRTVSWKIAKIPSGNRSSIRYQAVSVTPGRHRHQIATGMNGVFQGETVFDTVVSTTGANSMAIESVQTQ
jgi:hypothetical protein